MGILTIWVFFWTIKATTTNPLDSFGNSSAHPYSPCFVDNTLYLHDDRFKPQDESCVKCHCNEGAVVCEEIPGCKKQDCKYNNALFIHGQSIRVDLEVSQGVCRICHCNNGNYTCEETRNCTQKDCIINTKGIIIKHGQSDDDKGACATCYCINGVVAGCERLQAPGPECLGKECICKNVDLKHDQSINVGDHGDCQTCLCSHGFVTCKETPDCIKTDCIYKKQVLKHGHRTDDTINCQTCNCSNGNLNCEPILFCDGSSDKYYSSLSSSVLTDRSASASLLPCSYRGTQMLHSDSLVVDECTTCSCDNSTVKCDVQSCPSVFCDEPLDVAEECCDLCPYYLPVWKTSLGNLDGIQAGAVNDVTIDLKLNIIGAGPGVSGVGLWRVSMWGSANVDGSGTRIGLREQVLTSVQASKELIRRPFFGGYEFTIQDIQYSLDGRGATCSNMRFLCAKFGKGDKPDPLYQQLPFNVEGVLSDENITQAPESLIGCRLFPLCQDIPTSSSTAPTSMPETVVPTSIPSTTVLTPVLSTNFSLKNPAKVKITNTKITSRLTNDGSSVSVWTLQVRMKILAGAFNLTGTNLWKISLWGSLSKHGDGTRFGYIEQALNNKQASVPLVTDDTDKIIRFKLQIYDDIFYSVLLDRCSTFNYICAQFAKGDPNDPRYELVDVGRNVNLKPSNLIGCMKQINCYTPEDLKEAEADLKETVAIINAFLKTFSFSSGNNY